MTKEGGGMVLSLVGDQHVDLANQHGHGRVNTQELVSSFI